MSNRKGPRKLTVAELKAMRGDKIFIRHINACAGFYYDLTAPYWGNHEQYIADTPDGLAAVSLPLSHYGTAWIAFDRELTDA